MVYNWLNNALQTILPLRCTICGAAGALICSVCQADLPVLKSTCRRCGASLAKTNNQTHCGECISAPPHYHLTLSPFAYRPPINQLIAALKYQRRLSLVPLLANSLARHVELYASSVDALLPVPLHASKLRQRGFNQALELARPLARGFGLPLMLHTVERQRATPSQLSLHADERQRNVRNAFRVRQPCHYKRIAIVDDVMTTGSTVNEIARLLVQVGVEEIQIWCIARA